MNCGTNLKKWMYTEISRFYMKNNFGSGRPKVFYKKKRCSSKFHEIHRKTPVAESLFKIKLQTWGLQLYDKKDTVAQAFSCELCEISKNTFPYRTPLEEAASAIYEKIVKFTVELAGL